MRSSKIVIAKPESRVWPRRMESREIRSQGEKDKSYLAGISDPPAESAVCLDNSILGATNAACLWFNTRHSCCDWFVASLLSPNDLISWVPLLEARRLRI